MNNAGSINRRLILAGALIALCIAGIAVGTGNDRDISDSLFSIRDPYGLAVCGACFGAMVMLARIIVGAHCLSDVSTGSVLMLIISAVYLLICKNLYAERKSEQ